MPEQEIVVVKGPGGNLTAPDVEVKESDGATVIIWTAGQGVGGFEIAGLNAQQFTPQTHNPDKTRWTTVNQNTTPRAQRPKDYNYEIKPAGSKSPGVDPKITNVAG